LRRGGLLRSRRSSCRRVADCSRLVRRSCTVVVRWSFVKVIMNLRLRL